MQQSNESIDTASGMENSENFTQVVSKRSKKAPRPVTKEDVFCGLTKSVVDDIARKQTPTPTVVQTHRDAALARIRSIKEDPVTTSLGVAMEFMFGLMKDYASKVQLDNMQVHPIANFVEYIRPASRQFFDRVAYYHENDYERGSKNQTHPSTNCRDHTLSMWRWYVGASANRPVYIYICTEESYDGPNDPQPYLLNPIQASNNYLDDSRDDIEEYKRLIDAAPESCRADARARYNVYVRDLRAKLDGNVCNTFNNLEFFTEFKDAKHFITDRALVQVTFGIAKKTKVPTFTLEPEVFPELPAKKPTPSDTPSDEAAR